MIWVITVCKGILIRGKQEGNRRVRVREGDVTTEGKIGMMCSHEPGNVGSL